MLTGEMINKYYDMVDSNAHGEVLEEVAKDFNLEKHATILANINKIHSLEGCLSYDVMTLRDRIKEEVYNILENVLSLEEYKQLRSLI